MEGSPRRFRVLVAEDTPEVARRIAGLLREIDDVEVLGPVGDGVAALECIERLDPDAVVLDLNMPPPGGLEVLQSIRRAGLASTVIILTSHAEPSIRERCLELGADHFLHKATEFELLPQLVRDYRNRSAEGG